MRLTIEFYLGTLKRFRNLYFVSEQLGETTFFGSWNEMCQIYTQKIVLTGLCQYDTGIDVRLNDLHDRDVP